MSKESGTKFGIKRDIIRKALEKSSTVIDAKSDTPYLKYCGAYFNASSKTLVLISYGNNCEAGACVKISVSSSDFLSENSMFLFDPSAMLKIINNTTSEEIEIRVLEDKSKVKVKSGKHNFTLNAVDPSTFPIFPIFGWTEKKLIKNIATINSSLFKKMINIVSPAINPNDQRKAITGVNLEYDGNNLYSIGTNGKMGIFAEKPGKINTNINSIIIPFFAISPINKVLPDGEDVEVSFIKSEDDSDENKFILIENSSVQCYFKSFSSHIKYPSLESFFVGGIKSNKQESVLDSFSIEYTKFVEAVKLVSVTSHQNTREISLTYEYSDGPFGKIQLCSSSESGSTQTEKLECTHLKGGKFSIFVNCDCLERILSAISSNSIIIKHNGVENSPLTITSDGSGEIFIGTTTGRINKPAEDSESSDDNEAIEEVKEEYQPEEAIVSDGEEPELNF